MIGLTPQQSRALHIIRRYHAEHGWVPSASFIAESLGHPHNREIGQSLLDALVERGHLIRISRHTYRLNHEPIPADPLSHGWRFISVDQLPQASEGRA